MRGGAVQGHLVAEAFFGPLLQAAEKFGHARFAADFRVGRIITRFKVIVAGRVQKTRVLFPERVIRVDGGQPPQQRSGACAGEGKRVDRRGRERK